MRAKWWLGLLAVSGLLSGCITDKTQDNHLNIPTAADNAQEGARVHTDLAQRYLQDGNLEGALAKLQQALTFDPSYIPAQTVIAVVYERINQLPDAEIHYRRAVQLDPKKGDLNNNLGAFLCRVNRPNEGIPYLDAALADPFYHTPAVAWTNRGICDVQRGADSAAEADFRQALSHDAENPNALYRLAELFYKDHNLLRAEAFVQRLDALGTPDPDVLRLGYSIELQLGHADLAQAYAARLKSLYPDAPQTHSLDVAARP